MNDMIGFMQMIGHIIMQFWEIVLMFVIVMVVLFLQMPSVLFKFVIVFILCFGAASAYMVIDAY